MRRSIPTLLAYLFLATWISDTTQRVAAESAEDLLAKAENKLMSSECFAVDYTVQPEHNSGGWPGLVLGGRLIVQGDSSCYFTNSGGISIMPAMLTIVSDERSHLIIHSRGMEWVPERPGPIKLKQIAGFLPRGGISLVIVWAVADIDQKVRPDPDSQGRLPPLSNSELSVTDAQESGIEELPSGRARHIRFNVTLGTNQADRVDLWLDEQSGLPVQRISRDRG